MPTSGPPPAAPERAARLGRRVPGRAALARPVWRPTAARRGPTTGRPRGPPPRRGPRPGEPAGAGEERSAGERTEQLREAVVRELVRNDILYRRRAGEVPAAEEYLDRFPGLDRAWLARALAAPAEAQDSLPTPKPSR